RPRTVSTRVSPSGRTFPERCRPMVVVTSERSSKRSSRPRFQCLDLASGPTLEWSEGTGARWPGESSTLNISEWPNDAAACSLSQILEATVPPKFYLSAKACQGILRRAERRRKALPEVLRVALETVASQAP